MCRKTTIEKNRVYVECTDAYRKVKAKVISRDEQTIKVELPTGFVLELSRIRINSTYRLQVGLLEFVSDGRPVI